MTRLLELAKKGARMIGDGMEPDGSWLPTLMYLGSDGRCSILGLTLGDGQPGSLTPDDITRTGEHVAQVLREAGATEAVFVCGVLYALGDKQGEGVIVAHVTRETAGMELARVQRTDGPPEMGYWEQLARDLDVPSMVIVDAMRASI